MTVLKSLLKENKSIWTLKGENELEVLVPSVLKLTNMSYSSQWSIHMRAQLRNETCLLRDTYLGTLSAVVE